MPYKNIVFVKLEKRLLNDPRWWIMSDPAQLIYVKLILLAAETYNKIPLNDNVLREALRSKLELQSFQKCLEEIEKNFPKLRKNKHFRYFAEFETKTNYIPKRAIPRKSQGLPKDGVDKDKEEDIDKEKEKTPQEIYLHYSKIIKSGGKEDAVKSIHKLLTKDGFTKEDLLCRIDAYKQSILKSKKQDPEYYIQANNFFGLKARYKDFEPIKKIEYKPTNPNCKLCKGNGIVYIANTSETKICDCRIT